MIIAGKHSSIAGCIVLLVASALPAIAAQRPNIVILLADDMGYADVGFQGCRDIPTPNIDSIAQHGVRCSNFYVSCPYCSPTRAGLLTGRYQTRFGHEFNGGPQTPNFGLPLTETTLADRLKAAGYATGLVGKWHLGGEEKFHPQARGFEEFFGFLGGAHSYFPVKAPPILRGKTVVDEREYLTDALAREAVDFIDRHRAQPFFLYLAFNAVHTPMHATDARLKRFESIADTRRRTYAAMLTAMDEAIGKVLDRLRTAGLEENTLLVFFSDNGGPTMRGTTVNGSSNGPLRGSKRTTLEGGIRVPFAMQWKAALPAGKIYEQPTIQLDFFPTALAAAGIDARPEWKLDGVNLLPYFLGQKTDKPHETLLWRFGAQMAIRHGDWKLVRYDPNADSGDRSPRGRNLGTLTPRLYHLTDDIGEKNDQAATRPQQVAELETIWRRWNSEMAAPLWGGDN